MKPTPNPAAGAAMSVSDVWNSGSAKRPRETLERERPVLLAPAGSNRPAGGIRIVDLNANKQSLMPKLAAELDTRDNYQ